MTGKKDRNLKAIDGKWYLDFTHRGRRIRKFAGFNKEQARVALAKERLDRRDIELGLKKPPVEDVTFAQFADEFVKIYAKPNKKSWRGDENILEDLKDRFKGKNLREIDPASIERFKAERMTEESKTSGRKISPSTVNRGLSLLKTLFNKGVEWGNIEASPAARVKKLKEPPGRERFLTHEEAHRLLAASSPEFRPILIVALGTGMRRGEILGLRWIDVDLVRGIITVSMSKSGRSRKIPMNAAVAAALGGVPHRGEFVFTNPETKTCYRDVKTWFKAACAGAKKNPDDEKDPGITDVRFHDLRHTALSWMFQGGVSIKTVQAIAGHASIEMTARYIHERPEDQRVAVGILGGILDSTRQKVDTIPDARPAFHSFKDN